MSVLWLLFGLYLPLLVLLGVVATAVPASGQVVQIARNTLKPDPDNPRKSVDEGYIAGLAANIKLQGILVPLIVRPDFTIIDGFCRYLASGPAGLENLPRIVASQPLSPGQILAMQMATVMHRADISGFEKWQACERLLKLNPTWAQKDLAPNLSVSESMIVRFLAPGKTIPAWQEALKAGKVGISDCYEASKFDPATQEELLALKLSGASRDAIARAGRQRRNGSGEGDTTRLNRCPIPLPSGTQVIVASKNLSLADLIAALAEATTEAKAAAAQNLDIRTLAGVAKDKAAKKSAVPVEAAKDKVKKRT